MQPKLPLIPLVLCAMLVSGIAQAVAQGVPFNPRAEIQAACHAKITERGPESEELQRIMPRLYRVLPKHTFTLLFAVVDVDVINAFENRSTDGAIEAICIPVAMVRFVGDSEDELAFVVSHEIGHALDNECKTGAGRHSVSQSIDQRTQQIACESRADAIGLEILTRAGYNPYAAAGWFGRFEMYSGDTGTGILARFQALASDHPISPDRIKHMRDLLIRMENK